MIIAVYDYDNVKTEITLPDKEIVEIYVHVLSGDETGCVKFADGERVWFDASDCRMHSYDDGAYFVEGENIQKWIDFIPSEQGTVSYNRMREFYWEE